MHKNMAALAECANDFIKLRVLSARDPEVLEGYQRAWPQYFTETETTSVPLSSIKEEAEGIVAEAGVSLDCVDQFWTDACKKLGVPLLAVYFPWSDAYGVHGIPATRGLQFQCGDFSEIRNGSVVRLYHTRWVVMGFDAPINAGWMELAPLAAIDLNA